MPVHPYGEHNATTHGNSTHDGKVGCDHDVCPPGLVLKDGQCQCLEGMVLQDGKCVREEDPLCPEGSEFKENVCIMPLQCPKGAKLDGG